MNQHEEYMRLALELAAEARNAGEVPVGALLTCDGSIIGRGRNRSVGDVDPTAHAEVITLRDAARTVGNYRLVGSTMYCTVEPCLMCLGAMIHARVQTVVYGAHDPKAGGSSKLDALREAGTQFNHRFEVVGGVLAEQASELLVDFFRERRVEVEPVACAVHRGA